MRQRRKSYQAVIFILFLFYQKLIPNLHGLDGSMNTPPALTPKYTIVTLFPAELHANPVEPAAPSTVSAVTLSPAFTFISDRCPYQLSTPLP